MKRLILAFVLLSVATIGAQEKITNGTPITQPSITDYQPFSLSILPVSPVNAHPHITVQIIPTNATSATQVQSFDYPCPVGTCVNDNDAAVTALITALNGANLTTVVGGLQQTLWRRTFARLVADFPSRFSGGGTVQH
jgi:hypothetical protein